MSFWKQLGEGLKNTAIQTSEKAAKYQEEVDKQMQWHDRKNTEELIKEYKRTSSPMAKKVAIRKLLIERGVIND